MLTEEKKKELERLNAEKAEKRNAVMERMAVARSWAEEMEVMYHHFYLNKGRVTAAFCLDDKRNDFERELVVAFSWCSRRDAFSKKMGRLRATERLRGGDSAIWRITLRTDMSMRYQLTKILRVAATTDPLAPKWAL